MRGGNSTKKTHGMSRTPTYRSWVSMMYRCYSDKAGNTEYYYNKGITIHPSWWQFEQFLADMGLRPDGKTLDRIDGTKPYGPDNCRWADHSTQMQNKAAPHTNKVGIKGISLNRKGSYQVTVQYRGVKKNAYSGKDFFEACCVRRSWEAAQGV
jgi:hypothetical protein